MKHTLLFLLILIVFSCKKDYLESKFKLTNSESYYPQNEWENELGYHDTNYYNITLHSVSESPELAVEFGDKTFPLTLDFGTSNNLWITTELEGKIDYTITGEGVTTWPDGSFRGNIYYIKIPEIKLLNKKYYDVDATLNDWRLFSTTPFNGCISMDYFNGLRFTLDYKKQLLACIPQPFPYDTTTDYYLRINLIKMDYHPNGVHFMGEVNNKKSLIYFDTGRSKTEINRNLVDENKIISDKTGNFYNGTIPMKFDELELELQFPRVAELGGANTGYTFGICVGSDLLKYFVLTIDRTNNNDLLIIHK